MASRSGFSDLETAAKSGVNPSNSRLSSATKDRKRSRISSNVIAVDTPGHPITKGSGSVSLFYTPGRVRTANEKNAGPYRSPGRSLRNDRPYRLDSPPTRRQRLLGREIRG